MSWDDVVATAETLGVEHVPVVFRGHFQSFNEIGDLMKTSMSQPSKLGSTTPEVRKLKKQEKKRKKKKKEKKEKKEKEKNKHAFIIRDLL